MKKILLCILLLIPAVYAQTGDGAVVVKDIELPDEIYPGDSFNLSFRLENTWYNDIKEVYVYLDGTYPLLRVSPTEPYYITRLGYYFNTKLSKPLTFNLKVDEGAIAGTYVINIVVSYRRYSDAIGMRGGYGRYQTVIPVRLTVDGLPDVDIFVKKSIPTEIHAGDTAELILKVVNIGTEKARNILLYTSSVEGVDVSWFSRTFYVGDLLPQGDGTARITVEVDEDVRAGVYSLPVKILYQTPRGRMMKKEDVINITVEESADFSVYPLSVGVNSSDKDKQITYRLMNTGNREAEDVKVILKASYPFTLTGSEYFVGMLSPGESEEISFHVDVDSDASSQKYPVDIIVQWKEGDREYSKTKSSYVEVSSVKHIWPVYAGIVLSVIAFLILLSRIMRR